MAVQSVDIKNIDLLLKACQNRKPLKEEQKLLLFFLGNFYLTIGRS
jgi:hypothetical protein